MRIIICGVPRTGKTTLSKILKNNLHHHNLIVSESIRNGFQAMDEPNFANWGNKNSLQRKTLFPKFLFDFIKWNERFSGCDTILDLAIMNVETITKLFAGDSLIICLGFCGKDKKDIFEIVRRYEKEDDYTKNMSDEQLDRLWGGIVAEDKKNFEFCKAHDILYFDTSKKRDLVLKSIINLCINKETDLG